MALGLSMSNHQALQALTINAAKMSFKDKDLGSVEVVKLADLTIDSQRPRPSVRMWR
jgi:imidazolonepropionase-like amidohydrolase